MHRGTTLKINMAALIVIISKIVSIMMNLGKKCKNLGENKMFLYINIEISQINLIQQKTRVRGRYFIRTRSM